MWCRASSFLYLHNIMEDSAITSSAHTSGPWTVFGIKTDAPVIHTIKDGPAGVMVAIVSKEWGTEQEKKRQMPSSSLQLLIYSKPAMLPSNFDVQMEMTTNAGPLLSSMMPLRRRTATKDVRG